MKKSRKTWLAGWMLAGLTTAAPPAAAACLGPTDCSLQPFWRDTRIVDESLLFVSDGHGYFAKTLYPPETVESVRHPLSGKVYKEGVDYVYVPGERRLSLPTGSAIPGELRGALIDCQHPNPQNPARTAAGCVIQWDERRVYPQHQAVVTYTHAAAKLHVPLPAYQGKFLPRVLKRLAQGGQAKFHVQVFGDSISWGACSSEKNNLDPHQPPYIELVTRALAEHYNVDMDLRNYAVPGSVAQQGLPLVAAAPAGADLVIIAYGMNDASAAVPPATFRAQVQQLMAAARQRSPNVEFLLVSGMTANPDWVSAQEIYHIAYEGQLLALRGPHVAVVDVTPLWNWARTDKSFFALTGNGLNHPNDFGHRLYAQSVLAALIN